MRQKATFLDAILILLAFAAGASAFACAFAALFEDRDVLVLAFASGGVSLTVWAGARAVFPAGSRSRS